MNITNENNIKKVKKNKSLIVDKNVKIIELNDDLELEFIKTQNNDEKKKESNDNIMNIKNKETKKVREMGLDKFYTKKNISKMCIDLVDKEYKLETFDLIIEPSAGNGSFLEQIK